MAQKANRHHFKAISRSRAIALVRNDNIETGRIAARHFLSLGNFHAYGYIPAAYRSAGDTSDSAPSFPPARTSASVNLATKMS